MARSLPIYSVDDKVLCFHQELLYEAKILQTKLEDGEFIYKVHYKGWKATWDDWVPQERLRSITPDNVELARMLKAEVQSLNKSKSHKSDAHKKGASARASENSPAPGAPNSQIAAKKRGRDLETEREESYYSKPQFEVNLPEQLRSILVDDWENVTKNLLLARVPADIPAASVLDDWELFEKLRGRRSPAELDKLSETVQSFKRYFNHGCAKLLLYTFERLQFSTIYNRTLKGGDLEGKTMVDLYGPEHLLRLMASLPEFVATTNVDKARVTLIKEEMLNLGRYLAMPEHAQRYFSTPYEAASVSYKQRIP